jgi:hypothetical protein
VRANPEHVTPEPPTEAQCLMGVADGLTRAAFALVAWRRILPAGLKRRSVEALAIQVEDLQRSVNILWRSP